MASSTHALPNAATGKRQNAPIVAGVAFFVVIPNTLAYSVARLRITAPIAPVVTSSTFQEGLIIRRSMPAQPIVGTLYTDAMYGILAGAKPKKYWVLPHPTKTATFNQQDGSFDSESGKSH